MGSVWLADHLALQTQVVVKFMSTELGLDPASRDRFSREAVAASQVKSPHVVQTFDHGLTVEGTPFIVMELLEGEDLAHKIGKGPLPVAAVEAIITQVCRALARAHAVGIIHRDIKPDNIFLCDVGGDEPFVKLLDFGIAKSTLNPAPGSHTRTGAMMGTPYYMSPEQFAGTKGLDLRTDLWSLAVVAFECLTGVRPFEAETIGGLAIAVHSGPIPVPSAVRPGLGPALDEWFLRACFRDPAGRFPGAKEFADALSRSIADDRRGVSRPVASGAVARSSPHAPALVTTGGSGSLESTPAIPTTGAGGRFAVAGAVVLLGVLGTTWAFVGRRSPPGESVGAASNVVSSSRTFEVTAPPPAAVALPVALVTVEDAGTAHAAALDAPVPTHPVAPKASASAPRAASVPTSATPSTHPPPAPKPTADPFQLHVF